ncbi:MAG: flagellar hook-basal body complex protein [Rickettsiaceae bacterium]|nr:flagellar hook-basal body complex protein [Rickettsiaceae bacterium]
MVIGMDFATELECKIKLGIIMSQTGLGSAISAAQKTASVIAGNMSAAMSNGEKGFDFAVSTSITGYGAGGTQFGGSNTKYTQRITVQGDIQASNITTNMAIQGDGFFYVGDGAYTRLGDFEVDGKGFLSNSAGYTLRGWKLDDAGRKPGEAGNSDTRSSGDLSSLDKVNINGLLSKPKATTSISIDARLNSGASVITGAGQTFSFSTSDTYNAGNGNSDLIIPSGSGISIGDYFTVTVGSATKEYIYGGITSTFDLSVVSAFNASSSSAIFESSSAGSTYSAGGPAVTNDQLRIIVGSNTPIDLAFVPSGPRAESGEFNSLATLVDAINSSPLLKARRVNNQLFIAPKDGSSSVTFSNLGSGGTDFKAALGLSDITAYSGSNTQFNTLGQLKTALQSNTNLLAITPNSGSGIQITTKDPLEGIKFKSYAQRSNAIKYIYATQSDPTTAAGALISTSIGIKAPLSGLAVGDYVKISNLQGSAVFNGVANTLPTGLYRVLTVDDGGFTVAADQAVETGGAGDQVSEAVSAGATWQKMPAAAISSVSFTSSESIARGAYAMGATSYTVTFTKTAHGFASGDAISINGVGLQNGIAVPNGIYEVTTINANNFSISVPQIAASGASGAIGAGAMSAGTATKVGTTATDHTIEVAPVASSSGALVTFQMPNNVFHEGDYIAMSGTSIYTPTDGNRYKVVASTTSSFTFEVDSTADATGLVAAMTSAALPAGAYIDFFGKLDSEIGFDQAQDNVLMPAVYDAADGSGSNLVTGTFDGKWDVPLTIYDELGDPFAFTLSFAKISDVSWAAQVHAVVNPTTGKYPVVTGDDGIVASGSVTFNGNGTINTIDGIGSFVLNWDNGSNETTVTLNLGSSGSSGSSSLFSSGGLKHVHGSNQVLSLNQDGYQPGKFSYLSVDSETGTISANYDNGSSQSIYIVPLCHIRSPNTMTALGSATFTTSYESGPAILKTIGDDGVGRIVSLALEKSNVDNTEEMVKLITITAQSAYLSAAQQQLTNMSKDFSSRI